MNKAQFIYGVCVLEELLSQLQSIINNVDS